MAPRAATPSNKRKRGAADQGETRTSPARNGAAAATEAQFDDSGLRDIIAQTADGAANNAAATTSASAEAPAATAGDDSSLTNYQVPPSFDSQDNNDDSTLGFSSIKEGAGAIGSGPNAGSSSTPKPAVGSEEWHRIRRDNHKEVERRRRETINEGITEISKIVPGCDKNKGSILQRAIQYIGQLKENEQQNIEKWTLEKLLLDQAITELSATAERLKNDSKYYQRQRDAYKKACEENDCVPAEVAKESAVPPSAEGGDAKASTAEA